MANPANPARTQRLLVYWRRIGIAAFVEDAFGPVDVPVDVPVVRVSDPVPVLKVLRVRDPVLRGSVAVLQFFSLPNCLIL
jgi:hypothetical protein